MRLISIPVLALSVTLTTNSWASSSEASPNSVSPAALKKGDLLVSRLDLPTDLSDLEATTFAVRGSEPAHDRCQIEMHPRLTLPAPQKLQSVEVKTTTPEFDLIEFLEKMRPESEKIFNAIIDVDEFTGAWFKREDMSERIRMSFQLESFRSLPSHTQDSVRTYIEAHLRSYWNEVAKSAKRPPDELKAIMADARAQWITKLTQEVRWYLRGEAKKQKLVSDRLTETRVSLKFESIGEDGLKLRTDVQCRLEGESQGLESDRLNAVLNPYLEVVTPRAWAEERKAISEPSEPAPKRGVAVDGEPISR